MLKKDKYFLMKVTNLKNFIYYLADKLVYSKRDQNIQRTVF